MNPNTIINMPGLLLGALDKFKKQALVDEIDSIINSEPNNSTLSQKLKELRTTVLSSDYRVVIDYSLLKDVKKVAALLKPTEVEDFKIPVLGKEDEYTTFSDLLLNQMNLIKTDFSNISPDKIGGDFPREVHRLKVRSYAKPKFDFDVEKSKDPKADLLNSIEVISKKFGEFGNFDSIIEEKKKDTATSQKMIEDIVSKQKDSKTVRLIKAQSVTNISPIGMLAGRFVGNDYTIDHTKTTNKSVVSFWDDKVIISTVVEYTIKKLTKPSTGEYFTVKIELNRTFDKDMNACTEVELKTSDLDLSHIVNPDTRKNIKDLLDVTIEA